MFSTLSKTNCNFSVTFILSFANDFNFNQSKNLSRSKELTLMGLSNDKILDLSKFKLFADNKMNVAKMMIYVFHSAENIAGKEENVGYQHFLLFL